MSNIEIIVSVIGTAIIIPILSFATTWIKQHYETRKLDKKQAKRLDTLIECFSIYVQNNGVNDEVKKIIKDKIDRLNENDKEQ